MTITMNGRKNFKLYAPVTAYALIAENQATSLECVRWNTAVKRILPKMRVLPNPQHYSLQESDDSEFENFTDCQEYMSNII